MTDTRGWETEAVIDLLSGGYKTISFEKVEVFRIKCTKEFMDH